MQSDIFNQARRAISKNLIDSLITGEWQGKNKEICSPFRADKNPSIHMTEDGLWIDRATNDGGDLIDFISRRDNITKKEAAEKIIEMSGGIITEKKKEEQKKYKPVIPFSDDKLQLLNKHVTSKYITEKYGEPVKAWTYRNHEGKPWICTVRFEKDGKKDVVPFYFAEDEKFHAGNPVHKNRDLFNIDLVEHNSKIIFVEGEKCASIKVDGYVLVTTIGGVGQVEKSLISRLSNNDVIIWPDNDIPGYKYAEYIKSILPQSKILKINNKPEKWDIADAQKEGIDLLKFIEECEQYAPDEIKDRTDNRNDNSNDSRKNNNDDNKEKIIAPFLFLGHNEQSHFFLPRGSNIIKKISFGSFSKTKLLELAPLSFWCMDFPDKGDFAFNSAVDWIIRCSELQGFFFPERIRGTGVWIDDERIIVNDGDKLKDHSGEILTTINSKYFYVKSEKRMGAFSGDIADTDDGNNLISLVKAQGFQSDLEVAHIVGWSLIAPFGGILKWRPHIWITGSKGCGKSYILENIIEPICRPYMHRGSGKDSSPGIYRSLRNTPMPVILDEMEPGNANNKDTKQRIEEKLELARNASSDFSANITLTNKDGQGETFCTRSCFCCSSVVPHMMGEAIESRFLLSRMLSFEKVKDKPEKTKRILETGVMRDPEIFKRRMYYNLDIFLKNLQIIKDILYNEMPNRKADNYSPIFAAIWLLVMDGIIDDKKVITDFMMNMFEKVEQKETHSDEDILLREIFDYNIKQSTEGNISIAEMINDDTFNTSTENSANKLLTRYGIRKYRPDIDSKIPYADYIAIATAHSELREILKNTMYADRYVSVLERHPAAIADRPMIRFAGQAKRAVLLKWETIKKMYFDESIELKDDEDGFKIPF